MQNNGGAKSEHLGLESRRLEFEHGRNDLAEGT